jgi:hypothetical protein
MQVFINRTDLSDTNPPVVSSHPDLPVLPRDFLGTDVALLSLPSSAIQQNSQTGLTTLLSTWRTDNVNQIVYDEAYRRVQESFTEFQQVVALSQVQTAITKFGYDTTTWEPVYQNIYATSQSGFSYINAVRQKGQAMVTNLPTDPTADANWPTRIAAITMPTT